MSQDASNPWAVTEVQESIEEVNSDANPWGAASETTTSQTLSAGAPEPDAPFSIIDPFANELIPLESWVETGIGWVVGNFRPFFSAIKAPIDATLSSIEALLQSINPIFMILFMGLLAWQAAGKRLGVATMVSLFVVGAIGAWEESMTTLALVLTSVFFCMVVGIPSGIWMARSDKAQQVIRPILDAMQTTPAFVYLVPIVMLFGIGNVPGVVVTIIFAVPPVIRLTNLGIRQVPEDLIEAAQSFGASSKQMLFKVQLPLAMPTIMAGVNQTLMLSLSMVVIASMISVGGLGLMVLRGIGRLDIGLATVGGVGIVILAIILDRLTQSLGQSARDRGTRHWYEAGPIGLLRKISGKQQ
ncbi:glycine/betaine ABC transporter permease [Oleiphilus sp. HI0071]|uniref:glycine betaine/L-proline ABC transporter permease ProW n=2 Tax=unclassified Oleiphilus TaxID=2631174 RepID=UPI0007C3D942|nr:glycine betaine/L-proline ABC transporter permease ProW [Oleiphilus sp. HI0079]KZY67259.1 glycine/betaine ABC transporter permease [Oleiphilus sp. HI0065]KZY78923.1 glycine/betaine ABC transporter permease [Oleiphilus sp. HI0071]KZY91866.1 glycine/betaine ABC transporter permease [Oleiphilus sp. HI0073]KZZ49816.1 glycine/betaine ABC transporter permease [Oleiphilus sp. HI0118]KZZ57948.1 glycine/betaine ABC transporter permease [Oleiphilus sp. HI0122]KZZ73881.1 glycine/betaine ABC transport